MWANPWLLLGEVAFFGGPVIFNLIRMFYWRPLSEEEVDLQPYPAVQPWNDFPAPRSHREWDPTPLLRHLEQSAPPKRRKEWDPTPLLRHLEETSPKRRRAKRAM